MADEEDAQRHSDAPSHPGEIPVVNLLAEASAVPEHPPNHDLHQPSSNGGSSPFFNSAQWTADGTSILVGSSKQTVSAFVLPDDLLKSVESRPLKPQAVIQLPEPAQTVAPAPYFSLTEPTTQTFIAGCRDHPIQLHHVFPHDPHAPPLCSYKLIRRETEEYITPTSLLWPHPGTHFICGSANRLDYFDMSRPGSDGPVVTIPTIPSKRHIAKGGGVGMKGTVAALAASPPDADGGSIIAAGTWTRWVGLYDIYRSEKTVANWAVSNTRGLEDATNIGGQGIVQLLWSPCGRYLVVNERQSQGLLVYDIRGAGKLLGILNGRKATTQQKLTCDVFPGDTYSSGFEVWAGSQDGTVSVWNDVGARDGTANPSWDWKAHEAPVGSTILHSSGSVVATCSGGWEHLSMTDLERMPQDAEETMVSQTTLPESGLKIWSIGDSPEPCESR